MAKRFNELVCWQLSMQLKRRVDRILERPAVRRDATFLKQTDEAAGSAPRNIAEGFGRYQHKEFAHFLKIARASLLETQTNLVEARDKRYVTEEEFHELWSLAEQAVSTTTALWRYLARKRS